MEQFKIKAIVNFAKTYRVAEGGSTNEGITINYLMTDSLKPFDDETNGSQGYKSSKSSISLSLADKLVAVPGQYELTCELSVGSTGQPQLKPVDLEFISYCELRYADSIEELGNELFISEKKTETDSMKEDAEADSTKAADVNKQTANKEAVKK